MKKKQVINLIRYFTEKNESGFRTEAYEIAKSFDKSGDYQLAEYIMALLSDANTFVPQMNKEDIESLRKVSLLNLESLPLPEPISKDVIGIVNAVRRNIGVNKFLFERAPGTGKTETTKQITRLLERELYIVDFEAIVDSKLGQTSKNIASLFKEINSFSKPNRVVILFDEIDAIALNRLDTNDLREMGRATSAILKGIDSLNNEVVLIQDNLLDISNILMSDILKDFKQSGKNSKLLRKIISLMKPIPYPGELKNILKSAVAFSSLTDKYDYLRRIFTNAYKSIDEVSIEELKELGFTVREIEILKGISKSQVSRELKGC